MSFDELPPRAAYERVQQGARYLDVRTVAEFAAGHPEGALNIPVAVPNGPMMVFNQDFVEVVKKHFRPDEDIVVGCRSGGRSGQAIQVLRAHGFTGQLTNVAGGFLGGSVPGWQAEGLPSTTDTSGRSYEELSSDARD